MEKKCIGCNKEKAVRKCTLCQANLYCGEKCARSDWIKHQDDCNLFDVPPGFTVAFPYHYEDLATEKELHGTDVDSVYNEKFMVRTIHPDCRIETRIAKKLSVPGVPTADIQQTFGTLGVGEVPDTKKYGHYYRLTLTQDEYTVPSGERITGTTPALVVAGEIPKDMIFKGNAQNQMAAKLASSRKLLPGKADKLLFWPDPTEVQNRPVEISPIGGYINVVLELYDTAEDIIEENPISKAEMNFVYDDLRFKGRGKLMKFGRRLLGKASQQLKIKGLNPSNHAALHAESDSRMEIRLIYETTGRGDEGRLIKDVEILVPTKLFKRYAEKQRQEAQKETETPAQEYSEKETELLKKLGVTESSIEHFNCDPRDVDGVTGLYQSIEEKIGEIKEELKDSELSSYDRDTLKNTLSSYQTVAATINGHRIALEEADDPDEIQVSYQVKSAINMALKLNWERVGIRGWRAIDKSYKRLHQKDKIKSLALLVDYQLENLAPRGSKKTFKSWIKGERGKKKSELRAIEKILNERLVEPLYDDDTEDNILPLLEKINKYFRGK